VRNFWEQNFNFFFPKYQKPWVNMNKTQDILKCHNCGKTYKTRNTLTRHLKESYKCTSENGFSCPRCGKKFIRKYLMDKHLQNCTFTDIQSSNTAALQPPIVNVGDDLEAIENAPNLEGRQNFEANKGK
jgi:predicted RNA-binding Zn-ribbon protein involved in translation (DUF1610 family)